MIELSSVRGPDRRTPPTPAPATDPTPTPPTPDPARRPRRPRSWTARPGPHRAPRRRRGRPVRDRLHAAHAGTGPHRDIDGRAGRYHPHRERRRDRRTSTPTSCGRTWPTSARSCRWSTHGDLTSYTSPAGAGSTRPGRRRVGRRQDRGARATRRRPHPSPCPRSRLAGAHDIDRKFRDFGDDSFFASYYAAMTESYAQLSDAAAPGGHAGRGRRGGTPTAGQLLTNINALYAKVRAYGPTVIVVGFAVIDALAAITAANAPARSYPPPWLHAAAPLRAHRGRRPAWRSASRPPPSTSCPAHRSASRPSTWSRAASTRACSATTRRWLTSRSGLAKMTAMPTALQCGASSRVPAAADPSRAPLSPSTTTPRPARASDG